MSDEQHFTFRPRFFFFANAVAAGISFGTHGSIWWAIIHGLYGWMYIAYWAVKTWVVR